MIGEIKTIIKRNTFYLSVGSIQVRRIRRFRFASLGCLFIEKYSFRKFRNFFFYFMQSQNICHSIKQTLFGIFEWKRRPNGQS